jgi:CheY-like chemotaxis protein
MDHLVEILLVEDDPNDIKLTLHALQRQHLANHIHVARDGVEATEFLFCTGAYSGRNIANSPKVVLLDLKLPKASGLDVLRQVKSDPRTSTIPVVVLTSSAEDRDIDAAYHLGANSYIVKPVDFEQFTEAVRKLGLYWALLNLPPAPPPGDAGG